MVIAIPLTDGKLSLHFGHCQEFALVDVDDDTREVTQSRRLTPPPHEPGLLPKWLHEKGATVVIAGGMGQRAQMLFAQQNIQVITGADDALPEELVTAYLANTLRTGKNRCSE